VTSRRDELLALAEKVEAAKGADRELDCLIFESCHRLLTPERRGTIDGEPTGEYYGLDGEQLPVRAPRYTGSLDAALTLVPPLHGYYVRENCSRDGEVVYCNAQVWPYSDPRDEDAPRYWANAPEKLPALALTAGALKARAQALPPYGEG
jgi:hypothetical protein